MVSQVPHQTQFDEIFEAEFDYVCHTLRRFGVAERDVEDVAQDVFLGVHRRFQEYDPSRPVRPWLVAFAFRTASNYRRGRKRRESRAVAEDAAHTGDGRADAAQADRRRMVQSVLDQMSLERKMILLMYDVDGHTAAEIAHVLEVPLNTVYSRIRLARREFRTLGADLFNAESSHG
ncbi:MAG: sigma-70 family RNA polymerase sigma factor [Myxococcota bacterium]